MFAKLQPAYPIRAVSRSRPSLSSLPPASGPQVLLLSKRQAPINQAESTLLKMFFLNNLKPFEINTFEKQGRGSPLWLTDCFKKVYFTCGSLFNHLREPHFATLLFSTLCRKGGYPLFNPPLLLRAFRAPAALRDKLALFPIFHFHFSIFRSFLPLLGCTSLFALCETRREPHNRPGRN